LCDLESGKGRNRSSCTSRKVRDVFWVFCGWKGMNLWTGLSKSNTSLSSDTKIDVSLKVRCTSKLRRKENRSTTRCMALGRMGVCGYKRNGRGK